jgi:DNA-binding transcriptional ArsR family regulator/cell division protein FtsB
MRFERLSDEEETYSTIFTALRHPIRRRILRMLSVEPMTFTNVLNTLGVESSHLTYHLDSLGVLISKTDSGKYRLSTFGQAAVSMMGWVEEASTIEFKPVTLTTKWKAVFVLLVIGIAVFSGVYYSQYQVLSGLSMEYAELSEEFTQTKAEYTQIKTEYNETLLKYLEMLSDYNRLLEQAKKSLSYDDTPAYLCITRSFPWINETVSSNNLTEPDLILFPELEETINKLEARINKLETNDNTSEMSDNEVSVISFYSWEDPEAYAHIAHIAVAYVNNTRGRLIVEFLGANIVRAQFLDLDGEAYWHCDFFSDLRCGERAYHVWIFFDKTGFPLKLSSDLFLRYFRKFSSAHGSS